MNNQNNLPLIISAVLIVAAAIIGGVLLLKPTKKVEAPVVNEPANKIMNTNTQDQPVANAAPVNNQLAADPCDRSQVDSKIQSEKVDISNRTVTLTVKDFGKIQLSFYEKDAPKAVENFLRLVNSGYYNCLTFHRVSRNFVIQGGDPEGNGTGGYSVFGDTFADELNPATQSYKTGYKKGVLAMANRGPNTNGSQFFIMLEDKPLPNLYTIFGKVIIGQDVVDKIGQVALQGGASDGQPASPVIIEKAVIDSKK